MADYSQMRSVGLDELSLNKLDDLQLQEVVDWKETIGYKILKEYSEGIKSSLLEQLIDCPTTKDALREMARIQGRVETYKFLFSLPEKALKILKIRNAKNITQPGTENLIEE